MGMRALCLLLTPAALLPGSLVCACLPNIVRIYDCADLMKSNWQDVIHVIYM